MSDRKELIEWLGTIAAELQGQAAYAKAQGKMAVALRLVTRANWIENAIAALAEQPQLAEQPITQKVIHHPNGEYIVQLPGDEQPSQQAGAEVPKELLEQFRLDWANDRIACQHSREEYIANRAAAWARGQWVPVSERLPDQQQTTTARGFDLTTFTDLYGHRCSLQKSSLATEDAVWLGIDDPCPQVMHGDAKRLGVHTDATCGWVPYPLPKEVLLTTRMHLNQAQAHALIQALQHFVYTGDLPAPPGDGVRSE